LLYVPLAGLALMLAAMLDGAVETMRSSQRAAPVASAIVGASVAILTLGVLRESAIVTPVPRVD
jgi:hypothetical protein